MSRSLGLVVLGMLVALGCNAPGNEQVGELKEDVGDLRDELRDVRDEIRDLRDEIRELRKADSPVVAAAEDEPPPTPESDVEAPTAPPAKDAPPAQTTVKISLQSNPAGAKVFVGNRFVGTTPVLVQTEPGSEEMRILLEKEGYRARVMTLRPEEDTKISVQLAKK